MTISDAKAAENQEPVSDEPPPTTWAYGRIAIAASFAAILATGGLLYQTHILDQTERHLRAVKNAHLTEVEKLKGEIAKATNQADIMAGVREQFLAELGMARVQIIGLEKQLRYEDASAEALQVVDQALAATRIALSKAHQENDRLKQDLAAARSKVQPAFTSLSWRGSIPPNYIEIKK